MIKNNRAQVTPCLYPPVAQLDNAADSDSEERGFESLQAGQKKAKSRDLAFFSYIRLTARGIAVQ